MIQPIEVKNYRDGNNVPAGGYVKSTGLSIEWQNGALGRPPHRMEPNGAFVETVIAATIQRIEEYQDTAFKCRENAIALTHLETALLWLGKRSADRERRNVEGTHMP